MDDEALERLATRVDTKAGTEQLTRRPLRHHTAQAPHGWRRQAGTRSWLGRAIGRFSALELLFAGSIVFFIGAAAVSGLVILSGDNTVSTKNVSIAVVGPASIRAGDEVTLQIVVTNRNAVPMNLTDLLIEYPAGTRSAADVSVDLPRVRESLGTIQPGESVNRTHKAVMFGARGAPVQVTVTAEYRVPSSNAVFQSQSMYQAAISQSPATIAVESLREVVSGQPTAIIVRVTSNATENLTGMLLTAAYPPGFIVSSTEPRAVGGANVWDLGDIEPSGTRMVTINGTFTGEDGDDRVMHFTTGAKKKDDPYAIAAPMAATDATLTVAKPFVSVQLALNGDTSGERCASRGEAVTGEIRWTNNLPVRVQDVEIELKLNGAVLDKNSVRASQAFFRSVDSTLLFTKASDQRLASVEPGVTQASSFQFSALPPGVGSFKNAQITLTATVRAKRLSETAVPEVVVGTAGSVLTIASDLGLSAGLARVSGPLPPKAEQETVFTVTWGVTNSANALANTSVTGVLPAYVTWLGNQTSNVTYNESTRTVTWAIGDMAAGQGTSASFRIGVTPSVTQVQQAPVVVGAVRINAFDRFIRTAVERAAPDVTTATGTSLPQGTVVP